MVTGSQAAQWGCAIVWGPDSLVLCQLNSCIQGQGVIVWGPESLVLCELSGHGLAYKDGCIIVWEPDSLVLWECLRCNWCSSMETTQTSGHAFGICTRM